MPYEEEDLQWGEPDPALDALAYSVIGAAIEVHRELGPGLDEALYEEAMSHELTLRGMSFLRQPVIQVLYKGHKIGERKLDFIVEQRLVVELKTVSELIAVHKAQVRTYLKITKLQLGLLINFNVAVLKDGLKRVIAHS